MKAVRIEDYRPVFFGWPEDDDDDPFYIAVGEAFGGKAWTDGHILMAGEAPNAPTATKSPDFAPVEKRCHLDSLKKLVPFGVVDDGYNIVLVFDDLSTVQAKYYQLVVERWPDAEFFGDGHDRQITARDSSGNPVAALMSLLRGNRKELRAAIENSGMPVLSGAGQPQCPAETVES
jgi:hypothetical protein